MVKAVDSRPQDSVSELVSEGEPYHAMDIDSVLKALNSGRNGLTEKEARERLEKYGHNTLAERKRATTLQILLAQFKDFFVLLLLEPSLISALLVANETVARFSKTFPCYVLW